MANNGLRLFNGGASKRNYVFNMTKIAEFIYYQIRSGAFDRATKRRIMKLMQVGESSSEIVEIISEKEFIERKLLEKK